MSDNSSVLVIYTGGTIGMKADASLGGALKPFDFSQILNEVPELREFAVSIDSVSFTPFIDSSDITTEHWCKLAEVIRNNYDTYDGFVVLHGTDTMAYSASALSFMLENLAKPVVFTGSQLPIGVPRTDGRENLISAIEIASAKCPDGSARVPEVCVCFGSVLMRGNRTVKESADNFDAFRSPNLDVLARAGINIRYNDAIIRKWNGKPLNVHTDLDTSVSILKIYPGITENVVRSLLLDNKTKAVIIETYGAGNAPSSQWFLDLVRQSADSGKLLVNVTQCPAGNVDMSLYATGRKMQEAGVVSGGDSTTEAMLAKLYYLLGLKLDICECKRLLSESLRGEL